MEIDLETLPQPDRYKLLTSLVVPRPIAWVTSQSSDGILNAAPFSFFNVFGSKPPLVVLGIGNRPDTGAPKDTVLNIRATGEFVVNIVHQPLASKMVQSSAPYPSEIDELERHSIQTSPSTRVSPPRILGAPAALECIVHSIQEIGGNRLIIGEIKHAFVSDSYIDPETGRARTEDMQIVGRMHGADGYIGYDGLFQISRPD